MAAHTISCRPSLVHFAHTVNHFAFSEHAAFQVKLFQSLTCQSWTATLCSRNSGPDQRIRSDQHFALCLPLLAAFKLDPYAFFLRSPASIVQRGILHGHLFLTVLTFAYHAPGFTDHSVFMSASSGKRQISLLYLDFQQFLIQSQML